MAVAGRVSSICVIVGWVVISGMCASAELPGVIPMAAVMVVVVVDMVEGNSAVYWDIGYVIAMWLMNMACGCVRCMQVGAVGW